MDFKINNKEINNSKEYYLNQIKKITETKKEIFNNKEFEDFYNQVVGESKYKIKKTFQPNIINYIDVSYFENFSILEEYINIHDNKFNKLCVEFTNSNDLFSFFENNKIKSKEFVLIFNDINLFIEYYDDIEKVFSNKQNSISFRIKGFEKINDIEKISNIFYGYKIKQNSLLNNHMIEFVFRVNSKSYLNIQDYIISLYEKSKQSVRFFDFEFDYKSLQELTINDMNRFETIFSFLIKWLDSTQFDLHLRKKSNDPIQFKKLNINNPIHKLYINNNGDVYINKKFSKNNLYKLYNIKDINIDGEKMDYYTLSLVHQQITINRNNFITHFLPYNRIFHEFIDYYYNLTENNQIQNLSPEIEIIHGIIWKLRYFRKEQDDIIRNEGGQK